MRLLITIPIVLGVGVLIGRVLGGAVRRAIRADVRDEVARCARIQARFGPTRFDERIVRESQPEDFERAFRDR